MRDDMKTFNVFIEDLSQKNAQLRIKNRAKVLAAREKARNDAHELKKKNQAISAKAAAEEDSRLEKKKIEDRLTYGKPMFDDSKLKGTNTY